MAVDPNDLLIFKMRAPAGAQKQEQVTVPKPAEAKPAQPAPQPTPQPAQAPQAQQAPQTGMSEELRLESMATRAETNRMKEVDELELRLKQELAGLEQASMGKPVVQRPKTVSVVSSTVPNAFERISGIVFTLNAVVLGYLIFPSIGFLAGYINKVGFGDFLFNFSYGYGVTFVNMVLAFLSLMSGQLMFEKTWRTHVLGAIAGSMMLLTISYEYLFTNTASINPDYLLLVSFLAFASIFFLAVGGTRTVKTVTTQAAPQRVAWPSVSAA